MKYPTKKRKGGTAQITAHRPFPLLRSFSSSVDRPYFLIRSSGVSSINPSLANANFLTVLE